VTPEKSPAQGLAAAYDVIATQPIYRYTPSIILITDRR
jgi:hypothetical protein